MFLGDVSNPHSALDFFGESRILRYMIGDEKETKPLLPTFDVPHYYGNAIRGLFLAVGLLLLVATALDKELLNLYLRVGVFLVLVLTLLAGFTSPRIRSLIWAEVIVSAVLFVLFEYAVIEYLTTHDTLGFIFFLRQAIALAALGALYYSTKTLRGYVLRR